MKDSDTAKERVRIARLTRLFISLTIGTTGERKFKAMQTPDEYERWMKNLRGDKFAVGFN
jgi:hypothetical protein